MRLLCFNELDLILRRPPTGRANARPMTGSVAVSKDGLQYRFAIPATRPIFRFSWSGMTLNIIPSLQLLLPLAVVRCCKPVLGLPGIKERGDKHAFSSRRFCTYAAIGLAIWNIAGIGGSGLPGALFAHRGADHLPIPGV